MRVEEGISGGQWLGEGVGRARRSALWASKSNLGGGAEGGSREEILESAVRIGGSCLERSLTTET